MENYENRVDLTEFKEVIEHIRSITNNIIIGQEKIIDLILVSILSDGHSLLEGPPGIAKTFIAKIISKLLGCDFSRIQFTPDLMPSDVIGTSIFNMKNSEFTFRKGPIFSSIILIDEINRAPAKTQAALFEVMEEKQITYDNVEYKMSSPFLVLATQNPVEHEGTYRLPEAQLDRFLFKILIDYPSLENEIKILTNFNEKSNRAYLDELTPILSPSKITQLKETITHVHIEEQLLKYIAEIVNLTRNNPAIFLPASPRASLALMHASKSFAAINGRDFVIPDDIQFLAPHVLRHRISLQADKEMEGFNEDDIIKQIIEKVEVPR